jgi:hypothetical protein
VTSWLPADFAHPLREALPMGHHLRPMDAADVALDFPAVMGSRARLWARYGEAWGWPRATMTYEEDRADLQRHGEEIAAHVSFLYGVFPADESELLGCIYIDPPEDPSFDALCSWWVADNALESEVSRALDEFIPRWLTETWKFSAVDYSL